MLGNRQQLFDLIRRQASFLCVGLDPEMGKLPPGLQPGQPGEHPILTFNKAIIDATHDLCVAYKPNLAFYEALGPAGWDIFAATVDYIPDTHLVIADAKRGDIGNTSRLYAEAFFQQMGVDALTIAPYMGADSVTPFLGFPNKWVILLALTSNPGSQDFQFAPQDQGEPLFEKVMRKAMGWASPDELMFVVGATHPEQFVQIRAIAPDHFLLVPGVGAQGGDLQQICQHGLNRQCGLLINSSRGIIYASSGPDFAAAARQSALSLQKDMARILAEAGLG
ncbi:MAG: orotidine-5'-phosphate decarboxylase [Lewinellaceae bacterium]|nr:orotidine-5'-phosphate decarboxylase [Lewinellaceae bacterium]